MANRGDFDNDYDYDLDHVLAEVEYFSDDNSQDLQYKDQVIAYYLNRQDDRIERKKFVMDRDFLSTGANASGLKAGATISNRRDEKKKTKDEREIVNAMKVFARFQDHEAHENMVEGIIKERQIRDVINQLRKFHEAGFTGLD